jgi:Ca2+:H+ antiporter
MNRIQRTAVAGIVLLAALAGVAHFASWGTLPAFLLATLALGGLAWIVSFATENVGGHVGPAATGLLQATLGNLPELFVVLFALHAGQRVVAQSAIVGSLFATALLVLGLVLVVGSLRARDGIMHFHPKVARDTATLLLACVFIIVIVGLALSSGAVSRRHVTVISAAAAVLLLSVYLAWVIPYVRGDAAREGQAAPDCLRLGVALTLLIGAGTGAALVSDWFVDALGPAIHELHVSQAFAGLVIVAIASNSVEQMTGVVLAARRHADLAIAVVVNSVAQIAAFLFPAIVLLSLALPTRLTFALPPIYIGALAVMAILVWQVTDDGDGHPHEGWALIATYLVLAIITLYE